MLWGEEIKGPFSCTSTERRQRVEAGQRIDGHRQES
jgi:hypothetical protein